MEHVISVLVENRFGVLAHIAGMFSGRGFNIDSLAVGETLDPTISRMTVVVKGNDTIVQQIDSVSLDPAQDQNIVRVSGITRTTVEASDGTHVIEGGYLDIGLLDTMKDLFVNFLGALAFSILGYALVVNGGRATTRGQRLAVRLLVRPDSDVGSSGETDGLADD